MTYDRGKRNKNPLYIKVSELIYRYIRDENLQPGDRLPGERNLAALWNVSRPTVREAIRELENQGIVTAEVGKGTYITDSVDSPQFRVRLAAENFLELFEIKTALERYSLEKLVPVITQEQIRKLERMALRLLDLSSGGRMPEEEDLKFHRYLLECYGNRELTSMVMNIITMYRSLTEELHRYLDREKFDYTAALISTFPDHLQIVRKMRERDVNAVLESYDRIVGCDLNIYRKCFGRRK